MMWGDSTPRGYAESTKTIIDILVAKNFDARSWYPTEATPESDRTPILAVLDIGNTDDYVTAEHTMQVTAWEQQRSDAVDLRSDARKALIYHPGSDSVSWIRPVSMLDPVKDDVTGLWMAPVTIRMQLRALA